MKKSANLDEKNINVEAEGGELVLRNEGGDMAIIPEYNRTEALYYLNNQDWNSLNGIISGLPTAEAYAQDGSKYLKKPVIVVEPILKNKPAINKDRKYPSSFNNIVDKQNYWDSLVNEYGPGVKGRQDFLDLIEQKIPENAINDTIIPSKTWRNVIESRTDIENKPLFAASLLEEGGNKFTKEMTGVDKTSLMYDGKLYFGLDRIGERVDKMISKGLLDEDIKNRLEFQSSRNEKGEKIVSADFIDINDVVSVKNAFFRDERELVKKYLSDFKVEANDKVLDYWTVAAFNLGRSGAGRMMKSYMRQNVLENEGYLANDFTPSYYKTVHENVMRRFQVADMIKNELEFK